MTPDAPIKIGVWKWPFISFKVTVFFTFLLNIQINKFHYFSPFFFFFWLIYFLCFFLIEESHFKLLFFWSFSKDSIFYFIFCRNYQPKLENSPFFSFVLLIFFLGFSFFQFLKTEKLHFKFLFSGFSYKDSFFLFCRFFRPKLGFIPFFSLIFFLGFLLVSVTSLILSVFKFIPCSGFQIKTQIFFAPKLGFSIFLSFFADTLFGFFFFSVVESFISRTSSVLFGSLLIFRSGFQIKIPFLPRIYSNLKVWWF